jgi:pyruvate formate lyase activating enzyme
LAVTGVIFNIQRFSIHDGPGIRTTVFLKGCSLRCFWCHNPEGIRRKIEHQFFPSRCILCGVCVTTCPEGAQLLNGIGRIYRRDLCVTCGKCLEVCYAEALVPAGRIVTADEVVEEVLRDRAFYESSGGGVTLSGGEPVLQPEFAIAILELCRAEGLHTAIETAANCRWQELAALLPLTDLVMIDIKHMDSAAHRAVTGAGNERILANARRLADTDVPVIFRIPVVPAVNDSDEQIAAIASFVRELAERRATRRTPVILSGSSPSAPAPGLDSEESRPWIAEDRRAGGISLELLPFHRLAADKYRSLGMDYRAADLEPLSQARMAELAAVARACGAPLA